MAIRRTFIPWQQPLLSAVADQLVSRYRKGDRVDLEQLILVVPGRRAGRRLNELLLERTRDRYLLVPCRFETLGSLPERLYEPGKPFANQTTQILAWVDALKRQPESEIQQIIRGLPDSDDLGRWRALGELLWRLHRELAAEAMDFGEVLEKVVSVPGFPEQGRWQILRQVQKSYLSILDGLELWDRQTARLYAIEHGECRTEQEILLVGTVDMNRASREMLRAVAPKVEAIIHAPEALSNRFDDLGCLIPDAWQNLDQPLGDEQIFVADGPESQADAVLRFLAEGDGRWSTDDITIGLADESIAGPLQQRLESAEVQTRWFEGQTVSQTGPFRLLEALANFIRQPRFEELAHLVRHPDLAGWAEARQVPSGWLTELDRYRNRHLQARLDGWLGQSEKSAALQALVKKLEEMLQPLRTRRLSLSEWTEPLRQLLVELYGYRQLNRADGKDLRTIEALKQLAGALEELALVPDELIQDTGIEDAASLWFDLVRQQSITAPPAENAIELLGWLELALDDAPVLFVTSFNEGHVPASVNADLFLPNTLRRVLGIDDNRRRLARDIYATTVMQRVREHLRLIVGRRNHRGDPMMPSRLVFLTAEEMLAPRVKKVLDTPIAPPLIIKGRTDFPSRNLTVPSPQPPTEPLSEISVTAFRSYLECPYRYYLKHVLKLHDAEDGDRELQASTFGSLIHEVLESFGACPLRDSSDRKAITQFLLDERERIADARFGRSRLPAVEIQLIHLQPRLEAFAAWQADAVNEGWRIYANEEELVANPGFLDFNGTQVHLKGRIDRIDRHTETGVYRLLDYKTGESDRKPSQTHRRSGQWTDLQLPLYRHLAQDFLNLSFEEADQITLGYVVLPRETAKTGLRIAEWTPEELHDADQRARQVVEDIRSGQFGPPSADRRRMQMEFERICAAEWPDQAGKENNGGAA